jgi:hypothetical protein
VLPGYSCVFGGFGTSHSEASAVVVVTPSRRVRCDSVDRFIEQRQCLVSGLVELPSRFGQLQRRWCGEERLAGLLERPDFTADRRLRHEQFLRRPGKAEMPGSGAESAQQVE